MISAIRSQAGATEFRCKMAIVGGPSTNAILPKSPDRFLLPRDNGHKPVFFSTAKTAIAL